MANIPNEAKLDIVELDGESFIKISDTDEIRPFFMNIVSDSNHWMFIASNGGISVGRKSPEYALFPYYSDDKIIESSDSTGSKTIFQIHEKDEIKIWEPFKNKFSYAYKTRRNIYKNLHGNKIVLEEINNDLQLTFRYEWNNSNCFGFVKKSVLINNSDTTKQITILDGIQNILPYGISCELQRFASNLGDAYKRNELVASTSIGIFSLSAMIVDKAEPSEALKANVAWSIGLKNPKYLLSSLQVNDFRKGFEVFQENDIKGEKGSFFVVKDINLESNKSEKWKIIANVNQTYSNIVSLSNSILNNPSLEQEVDNDIERGTSGLTQLVASADGLQSTKNTYSDIRHYSNVLFNIMRGGIFDNNYVIDKEDFIDYLKNANKDVLDRNNELLADLNSEILRNDLKKIVSSANDTDLLRLTIEYLPLKFSRRHGDPSRPWNYFTINTIDESTGKKVLDYEGNWRDLFQNWEALAHAYPEYIDAMIFKFLNNSTFDGYNPYRVTKKGFDWEVIEPDNPWSYIGYWGDHQIIYLQKFLEIASNYFPEKLDSYLVQDLFVYAAVPYVIKPYQSLLDNPQETIDFDEEWDAEIREKRDKLGADGTLLTLDDGQIYKVNMLEKLLATVLSKLSNFIPEAGIWMNTQRPEWNDANNALVGNGVSMVTLYYLRRFLKHWQKSLSNSKHHETMISEELKVYFTKMHNTFINFKPILGTKINDTNRKEILDQLGSAASEFRTNIYANGFYGKKKSISINDIKEFIDNSIEFINHSILANKRPDKLYHAYNLMSATDSEISISHLDHMLEGQVAVLSSGFLSSEESLEVLNSLRSSNLYRKDQNSYILYPNKELPGFLQKNIIPEPKVRSSRLLTLMVDNEDHQIIEKDSNGKYHFNGNFKNVQDLIEVLRNIKDSQYSEIVQSESDLIEKIFEEVFDHKAFTGRSGTFFAYEGLGSIYWHMVSKLLLATQECYFSSISEQKPEISDALATHYFNIKEGIGLHKSLKDYGAFPTDPYSHTPLHRGAQQPGMTGQVKEDILSNYGELGVMVKNGRIIFKPALLREKFFTDKRQSFNYVNKTGELIGTELNKHSLGFTLCQTPIIYQLAQKKWVKVQYSNGKAVEFNSLELNKEISKEIFNRSAKITSIKVSITKNCLNQS